MQGLLLVDKPAGWTSFDVVNYVRKLAATTEGKRPRQIKVGHTGTLDPFATGLLIVLLGREYTRRAEEWSNLPKAYNFTVRLGAISTTGDPEGEITAVEGPIPTRAQVESALARFRGEIKQIPPAYSAIKVGGARAYKLARSGQTVALEPRKVHINRLELLDYKYPNLKLAAEVSSGTYIRSLAEDIGRALGTSAYTEELRRVSIGPYSVERAIRLNKQTGLDLAQHIIS